MDSLKVLTLNSWGIAAPWPIGSKDRRLRILAIADALASGEWDIVALQEIWSVGDFEIIKERVARKMPSAFYFHSGLIGSGICIFTKGTIRSTLMYRYSLNGYPHHVHHGDWFGGKVVGLARINYRDWDIDVYATHLHAEYDKENDLYLPHRVLQAYELSQFINETKRGDLAILMGDLNLEPTDLGYQLIVSSAGLSDAYLNRLNKADVCEGTCDVPTNCYSYRATLERWPNGKRIDYILYRPDRDHTIVIQEYLRPLGKIPLAPEISYSDHEAVQATFEISEAVNQTVNLAGYLTFPDAAIRLMQAGIDKSITKCRWCYGILLILVMLFIYTIDIELKYRDYGVTYIVWITRFFLTLAIGYIFIYGFIGLTMEQKALQAAKEGMLILKRANEDEEE